MDEELRSKIEELRANRGRTRYEREEFGWEERAPSGKKGESFGGTLTFQGIVAVIIAIFFVAMHFFAPDTAQGVQALIRKTASEDFSFRGDLEQSVGGFLRYLNEIEPVDAGTSSEDGTSSRQEDAAGTSGEESQADHTASEEENGAGGEYTPADGNALPDNATFAPVIFTGRISLPMENASRITSVFGFREHPITGKADFHNGVDIAAAKGTAVLAVMDGVVESRGESSGLGKYLILSHGNGFYTVYGHCDRLIAREGARIREGEVIARVGNTGDSTGYHLHFSMKKDGLYFNPGYVFAELNDVTV